MRLIAGWVWIIVVTSASAYVSSTWRARATDSETPVKRAGDLERKKTMPINVPMIANGNVEGYDFITDEAFRELYTGEVDFNHLQKYDLQGLTKALAQEINQRLGREIIKDVLVEEFTYVPKRDISR